MNLRPKRIAGLVPLLVLYLLEEVLRFFEWMWFDFRVLAEWVSSDTGIEEIEQRLLEEKKKARSSVDS